MKNAQLEFNAIAYVMQQKDPSLLVSVLPEFFGNEELRKLFLMIRRYYTETSQYPGWDILAAQVAKVCKTPEKAKFMMSLLDQIRERDIEGLTTEGLLKELADYHRFRTVLAKVDPLIKSVEDKDIDATLGTLKELHDSVFVKAAAGNLIDECDMESLLGKKIRFEFRTTGIKPIDDRGGLIKGGYTILAAPSKQGKSTFCGMIGLHQYLHEEGSIAYFSFEMSKEEVSARLLSNYADLEVGEMMSDELSVEDTIKLRKAQTTFHYGDSEEVLKFFEDNKEVPEVEYYEALKASFPHRPNRFYIFDARDNWDDLFVKMNLMATTKGVKTFIVDSPNLVGRGHADRDLAQWAYDLLKSKQLKTFSHEHKLNVIAPHQLNPGGKNEDPKLRFVTNAIQDTDLTLFVTEHEEDKTLGAVTVTFRAFRSFKTIKGASPYPEPFKLLKELNKSRFTYMEF